MFFFRNCREPVTGGDVFASIILFLVIFIIIIILVIYVGLFMLFIFLGIGVGIGLIYSIIIYVKSFRSTLPSIKGITSKGPISTFLLKYFTLLKDTSIFAFKDNLGIAQNAIIKAHSYKLFSFRKWMWLVVAPAVLVIGTGLIIILALLQFKLLALANLIGLSIIGLIILICAVINMFMAFAQNVSILKKARAGYKIQCFDFSRSSTYRLFTDSCETYWRNFTAIIKNIIINIMTAIKDYYADAISYGLFNIKRYYFLGIIVSTFIATLLFVIGVVVIRIMVFVPLILANIMWTSIITIATH